MHCISPLDSRYSKDVSCISRYFSEFALNKTRVKIEVDYLVYLTDLLDDVTGLNDTRRKQLNQIYVDFDQSDFIEIKGIEETTRHDIKAIEYFLQKKFRNLGLENYIRYLHFGLTSDDINSVTYSYLIKKYLSEIYSTELNNLIEQLANLADIHTNTVMLAFTHGQPATPTTVGLQLQVFTTRLERQLEILKNITHYAKFGGATGGLNAHYFSYSNYNWDDLFNKFLKTNYDLERSYPTTQIDHNDNLAEIFDNLKRINVILVDLAVDFWLYISKKYFYLEPQEQEVGSSTMPHKINPIFFENAEGNLLLANQLFEFFSKKLPCSRLQRDLTSSTVMRNIGVAFGYSKVAFANLNKGLSRLKVNTDVISSELNNNYAVIGEAVQTLLRKAGIDNSYELCKSLTRKLDQVNEASFVKVIDELDLDIEIKKLLFELKPNNYIK